MTGAFLGCSIGEGEGGARDHVTPADDLCTFRWRGHGSPLRFGSRSWALPTAKGQLRAQKRKCRRGATGVECSWCLCLSLSLQNRHPRFDAKVAAA